MTSSDIAVTETPFWLKDNFAPVFTEITEDELSVTGTIPSELKGRYFRNGANPPSGKSEDWFLACGMIHGVELDGGKAKWYRNRYVQTPLLEEETPSQESRMKLENSIANTHVVGHAGKILALAELSLPIEVTETLETVGPYTFDDKLKANMTAHPKICPITGEMLFFGYSFRPPFLTYYRASASGELVQSEIIDVKGGTMAHDFSITENYVIFMDLPVIFDMELRMAGKLGIRFDEEYGARFGVMPRDGSSKDVVWFEIDPCYIFHTMNAYENGDEIVLDGCRLIGYLSEDSDESPLPRLHQWRMNLKTGAVTERQIDDLPMDFPKVPDSKVGQPYRYGYTAGLGTGAPVAVGYYKYDMTDGSKTSHMLKDGFTGGEAVFVPAANGVSEDDGYLLSYIHNEATDKSDLVIFDAKNIANDPLAVIHLPARVPAGFHGSWIPDV